MRITALTLKKKKNQKPKNCLPVLAVFLLWVPKDIFFSSIWLMVRDEAASTRRDPYETVGTVHFILGILRTDLWTQGTVF